MTRFLTVKLFRLRLTPVRFTSPLPIFQAICHLPFLRLTLCLALRADPWFGLFTPRLANERRRLIDFFVLIFRGRPTLSCLRLPHCAHYAPEPLSDRPHWMTKPGLQQARSYSQLPSPRLPAASSCGTV